MEICTMVRRFSFIYLFYFFFNLIYILHSNVLLLWYSFKDKGYTLVSHFSLRFSSQKSYMASPLLRELNSWRCWGVFPALFIIQTAICYLKLLFITKGCAGLAARGGCAGMKGMLDPPVGAATAAAGTQSYPDIYLPSAHITLLSLPLTQPQFIHFYTYSTFTPTQ